jgi:protein SCO1
MTLSLIRRWVWIGLAVAIILTIGFSFHRSRVPAIVHDVYQGTALAEPAPDFRLVDQTNNPVALSDLRGRVVVLTFIDSQCADVCPLTALHFREVYQTLGADAPVTFIGVNVNLQANTVADVQATTRHWRLDELPAWHFLTGSREELEPVWQAYNVAAHTMAEGMLVHTPGVYLIDQRGQKRWYVSVPYDETGASPGLTPLNELLMQHIQTLLREEATL